MVCFCLVARGGWLEMTRDDRVVGLARTGGTQLLVLSTYAQPQVVIIGSKTC